MHSTPASRTSYVYLFVFSLFLSVGGIAIASPLNLNLQNAGGVHSAVDGSSATSTLKVNVSLNGKAAANATVEISASGGSVLASGSTSSSGIYSTRVVAGTYTITVTSGTKTASKTVNVSAATVVNLSLSPQS